MLLAWGISVSQRHLVGSWLAENAASWGALVFNKVILLGAG